MAGCVVILGFFTLKIYPELEYSGYGGGHSCTGECYEEYVRINGTSVDILKIPNVINIKLVKYFPKIKFGLGSILKLESFNNIDKKKFNFFVSPSTISEIVTKMPQNYIPGAETISEFNYLYNLGYKVIKFFPATLNDGCKKLKSIETIYKDLYFIPTGGINKKNMNDFLDLNNVICVGMTSI